MIYEVVTTNLKPGTVAEVEDRFAERTEVRAKVSAAQAWPPSAIAKREGRKPESFLEQENQILMPAKFSPLQ